MIAFRTTLALACVSATALAGHGGYYDDLGSGHGSLYGYGIGGMSYGLSYGKRTTGGYSKNLVSRPQLAHGRYEQGLGLGHGGFSQHGLNFGGYDRDIAAIPSAGFAKGYGIGNDLGQHYGSTDYGAGYAVGYGKAISHPISDASIAIGKGYGDLSLLGGYGNLAGHHGKAIGSTPIVKEFGGAGLGHGYGGVGLGSAFGGAGLGYGYRQAGLTNAYRGVGYGHGYGQGYGGNQRLVDYSKGLTAPLSIQKNFAAYGDELGYGGRYSGPFVSTGSANYAGHGTPVYSGIVKAGVPVSLARKW